MLCAELLNFRPVMQARLWIEQRPAGTQRTRMGSSIECCPKADATGQRVLIPLLAYEDPSCVDVNGSMGLRKAGSEREIR
jgi:hypothetical protein